MRTVQDDFKTLPSISVCIIHKNDSEMLRFCIESVKTIADEIIIIDDRSEKHHLDNIFSYTNDSRVRIIESDGKHLDGMIRNKYLEYASKDWLLIIDSDEILGDTGYLLKDIARKAEENPELPTVYDIHMIHFIYHLNNVDATQPKHFVPRRFFKNVPGMNYVDTHKHGVLQGPYRDVGKIEEITIYHYSHCKGLLLSVRWKYEDNIKRSEIHDPHFMNWWRKNLLNGTYPTSRITDNLEEVGSFHPLPIRRLIEEDANKDWKNSFIINQTI